MALVGGRWISSAGRMRKPARPVMMTKGRGSVRTWAMRPVSTTSHTTMMVTSRNWRYGKNACMSAALPGVAVDCRRREPAHEDVQCLCGGRLVTCEHVDDGEPALGQ